VMLGSVKIGRVRSTGHDISVVVEDQITVLMPLSGTVTSEIQDTTFRASANEALVLSPNPRRTRVEADNQNFKAIPLVFPLKSVVDLAESLGGSARTRKHLKSFGLTVSLGPKSIGARFSQMVCMLVDDLETGKRSLSKMAAQSWSYLLTENLVTLLDANGVMELPGTGRSGRAERLVLRAEDYMHEHFAIITSASDIARECGVSIRALEMAFKTTGGLTPMSRLAGIRLDQARQLLCRQSGAESVTQAAMDCGFNHLGRFSFAYKRQFGEAPSETFRKQ